MRERTTGGRPHGTILREWREARGWTQDELAERLYVDRRQVGRWERGESPLRAVRLDQIEAVARRYRGPRPDFGRR